MAMADYYLCDQCGGKAIYDAHWYDDAERSEADICIVCRTCKEGGYSTQVVAPPSNLVTRPPDETCQGPGTDGDGCRGAADFNEVLGARICYGCDSLREKQCWPRGWSNRLCKAAFWCWDCKEKHVEIDGDTCRSCTDSEERRGDEGRQGDGS